MNLREEIRSRIAFHYDAIHDAATVSPSTLAAMVFDEYATGSEVPQIAYTSIESIKQIAREFLRRCDPQGDESEAYAPQGELDLGETRFRGLQARYPIPRAPGEEPVYKLRHLLTPEERAFNVSLLRKSALARMEHADALEAEAEEANRQMEQENG